jgi:hypothetical protein
MKKKYRLLSLALFGSAAALLVIIVCAHQFRWGKYLPVQDVTPEEMVNRLKTSNVDVVLTTRSGGLWIQTKLGSQYQTTWKAIPGTDYENTHDALNLIQQILIKERGLEPGKDFRIDLRSFMDDRTPAAYNYNYKRKK